MMRVSPESRTWRGCLPLELVRQARDSNDRRGSRAVLGADPILQELDRFHYLERILATLERRVGGRRLELFGVRSSTGAPPATPPTRPPRGQNARGMEAGACRWFAPSTAAAPRGPRPPRDRRLSDSLPGSPLDRRLSFSTFLVGRSNQLAYSAAQRVTENRAGQIAGFQPAVHSRRGRARQDPSAAGDRPRGDCPGRRAIYLTAEKFMYGFVAALKAQTAIAFKEPCARSTC